MKKVACKLLPLILTFILFGTISFGGCSDSGESPVSSQMTDETLAVAVVLDEAGDDGNAFNEFTLKGARQASEELGLKFDYVVSSDYEADIADFADRGYDLIITVGFLMTEATENAAKANPDIRFAIVDVDYPSYDGLSNVTSLTFAEDEAGYLAGVLAGCMTETNVIGSVSGMELPPVVRFVTGFQEGAKSVNPDIVTLNEYIPDFNDPQSGLALGGEFISQGADVIFGVGGNTGNAGLQAACDENLMAIGIDVDQYYTLPEVSSCLISSAMKNVDVAADQAVRDFLFGRLESGVLKATVANGGIALAPYHDWEDKIPAECKMRVDEAIQSLMAQ